MSDHLRKLLDGIEGEVEYQIDGRVVTREELEAAHAEGLLRARSGWPCLLEILDPRGEFLRGRSRNVTSQFGEDGLIAATFEKIGTKNKWCFEVGAGDGVNLSNTKVLRDAGWTAVLIEADARLVGKMRDSGEQRWVLCHIGPDSLDWILQGYAVPKDLDLGVIDIDGQDYHIFAGLNLFRPRVLLVEYNMQDAPVPPLGGEGQAGLTAILELGKQKGYAALARTNCNVLFVAQEAL